MKKFYLYLLIILFSMSVSVYASTLKQFNTEELQKYNGQNSAPSYIAVDGVVYDVTKVPSWKDGKHFGYEAGKDLSVEIKEYPRMIELLKTVPVMGSFNK